MSNKYDFRIYQNPDGGWTPVMWAQQNITMKFTAPQEFCGVGFKVFQVFPEDDGNMPTDWPKDGPTNAKEAKAYVIANPQEFNNWDPQNDRYSGSDGPTFTALVPTNDQHSIIITDKHNGGKKSNDDTDVDPVYDFILAYCDVSDPEKVTLVDPCIRNEY